MQVVCLHCITNYYGYGEPVVEVKGNILLCIANELFFWDMKTATQIDSLQVGVPSTPEAMAKVFASVQWDKHHILIHTAQHRVAVWKRIPANKYLKLLKEEEETVINKVYVPNYNSNYSVLNALAHKQPLLESCNSKVVKVHDLQLKTGDLFLLLDAKTSTVVDLGLIVNLENVYYVWHLERRDALSSFYLQAKRGLMQLSQLHYFASRETVLNDGKLVIAVRGLYRSLSSDQEAKLISLVIASCSPQQSANSSVPLLGVDDYLALPRVHFAWNTIAAALQDVEFGNEHVADQWQIWYPLKHEHLVTRCQ